MVKVPDGRYALEVDGDVKFYKVNTPTRGNWKGFTFLSVQASDDLWPIKDRATKAAILGAIAADTAAAFALYGQKIGRCGMCGRTLTSKFRELGIGPECIKKF